MQEWRMSDDAEVRLTLGGFPIEAVSCECMHALVRFSRNEVACLFPISRIIFAVRTDIKSVFCSRKRKMYRQKSGIDAL
jgi:hypothetical protein